MKTIDLQVRPIRHRREDRVRAHVFLCMLAYYVEWHMRRALAPLLFEDHNRADIQRASVVRKAARSPAADRKATTKRTEDDFAAQSFRSLLGQLGTIVKNWVRPPRPQAHPSRWSRSPTGTSDGHSICSGSRSDRSHEHDRPKCAQPERRQGFTCARLRELPSRLWALGFGLAVFGHR